MESARSSAWRRARATFVSGPTATIHVPGWRRHDSTMKATASVESARRDGSGRAAPSRPLAPWTSTAALGSASSGRSAPAWTGTSMPSSSRITRALPRRAVERGVGDRGDADEVGRVGGDDDGDGVVVAGVAVEQDARPLGCVEIPNTEHSRLVDANGSADPLAVGQRARRGRLARRRPCPAAVGQLAGGDRPCGTPPRSCITVYASIIRGRLGGVVVGSEPACR